MLVISIHSKYEHHQSSLKTLSTTLTSPGSMHDTGCLGLVHWDDPEGWYGEWGGRRVQDGEHMYTCGGFILIFGKTNTIICIVLYCIVKFKNKIKLKKRMLIK